MAEWDEDDTALVALLVQNKDKLSGELHDAVDALPVSKSLTDAAVQKVIAAAEGSPGEEGVDHELRAMVTEAKLGTKTVPARKFRVSKATINKKHVARLAGKSRSRGVAMKKTSNRADPGLRKQQTGEMLRCVMHGTPPPSSSPPRLLFFVFLLLTR